MLFRSVNLQTAMAEEGSLLQPWVDVLPQQLHAIFNEKVHGDQQRWLDALENLPAINDVELDLNKDRIALSSQSINEELSARINDGMQQLRPWRKGPFQFFDTHIDTEWRSDWKWQRIAPHLAPLAGRRFWMSAVARVITCGAC